VAAAHIVDCASWQKTCWKCITAACPEPVEGTAITLTTVARILPYSTDIATMLFTAHGAHDNGPCSEEPREGKALTRGSGVAQERSTAPATIT